MKYGTMCMLVLVMAATLCVGCGGKSGDSVVGSAKDAVKEKVAEKAMEKAIESSASTKDQKVNVDLKPGGEGMTMTVSGDKGKTQMVMGSSATIPANFPKDVPQYPGMALSQVIASEENETFSLQASTKDDMEKVASHFKAEAAKNGWKEEMAMTQSGETPMTMLNYSKEGRVFHVMLSTEEGQTNISLTTAKQ